MAISTITAPRIRSIDRIREALTGGCATSGAACGIAATVPTFDETCTPSWKAIVRLLRTPYVGCAPGRSQEERIRLSARYDARSKARHRRVRIRMVRRPAHRGVPEEPAHLSHVDCRPRRGAHARGAHQ